MGYFPNGSAGIDYEATYCETCMNHRDLGDGRGEGCPVWDLHLLWSYEACNGKTEPETSAKNAQFIALEHFIPRAENGGGNEQCKMYLPKVGTELVLDKTDALKEWEAIYGKRTI